MDDIKPGLLEKPKNAIRRIIMFLVIIFVIIYTENITVYAAKLPGTKNPVTFLGDEEKENDEFNYSKIVAFSIFILNESQNIYTTIENNFFVEEQTLEELDYSEEDITLLATVISAEAGGCDDDEQYRVGNVVINRMLDNTHKEFAKVDTIKKVIYQENQFSSVGGTAWNRGPTEKSIQIAKDLLEGKRVLPKNVVWFSKAKLFGEVFYTSEWHVFSGWPEEETEEE
jgi:spore germination cell wall hydrolase CwlJ-like protein